MNGKLKGIIACGVIVVCLSGGLIALELTDNNNVGSSSEAETSSVNTESEEIMLIDSTQEDVVAVKVSNQYGEFTVEKPDSGKTSWTIKSLEGLNQSISQETSLIEDAAQLEAKKMVEENADDLSKYGFDDPQSIFEVQFEDDTRTFYVGDTMPEQTNYSYIKESNDNKVYSILTNKIESFLADKRDFLDKTLIATLEEEQEEYGKLTIHRPDLEKDMIFTDDSNDDTAMMSAQVMISPIYSYLNATSSANTTHGLWGLTAESAEILLPKESDFKNYGLDSPVAVVYYSGNGNEYELRIGNPIYGKDSEGNDTTEISAYYCYLKGVDGVDCIWTISAQSLPWVTVVPEDIITSVMTYNEITTVDEIVAEYQGEATSYTITSDDTDVQAAYIDGKETDVDQFKSFYQYILTCPTSEIYSVDPKNDSFLSIEIRVGDGKDTLEFFTDDNSQRKAVVKLNGVTSYRIPIKWTEKFINNMTLLADGKEVEESY